MSIDLVIIDLAGTTIRDDAQISRALEQALSGQGVDVTARQIADLRGTSKREAIARLLPVDAEHAGRCDRAFATFRRHLLTAFAERPAELIPGARYTLEYLRTKGMRLALTTGLPRDITDAILRQTDWPSNTWDAVVCGDDVSAGRPAPYLIFKAMESAGVSDVHRVVNVGDSANDLRSAFKAGVRWNVGVLSGAHDRQTLAAAPHTELLDSIADLPHFVDRCIRTDESHSAPDAYVARLKELAGSEDPVEILADTPRQLERLVSHAAPDLLTRRPEPAKWSVAEILAHLADCEVVFAHRLRMLLSASPKELTPFDPDVWAEAFVYRTSDPQESLALFAAVRAANVRLVRRVPGQYLARVGTHEEWGEETAAGLLRIEAGHDRNHLAQVRRALAVHENI